MNNVLVAVQQLIDKQKAEIAELKATSLKSAEIIISYESQIDMLAIDVTESEAEIAELTKGFNVLDNLLTLSNKRNNEAVGSLKAQAAEIAELKEKLEGAYNLIRKSSCDDADAIEKIANKWSLSDDNKQAASHLHWEAEQLRKGEA